MRYARIVIGDRIAWAVVTEHGFRELTGPPHDGVDMSGATIDRSAARLIAPAAPSKIFCLGRNYAAHRSEMGFAHDGAPSVFMKPPTTIIGPGDDIVLPPARLSEHVEHEAELAVIIGKRARFVGAADAWSYILGFTCANDVSARDLQRGDPHPTRGKGFDTFCPVGPWIETDLDVASGLRLRCSVNGVLRQDASTADMTYDIPFLIEYLSGFATLLPGDLILTGSPGGTEAIHAGDTVEVDVEGIGTLVTGVVAAKLA
ncbi:fumarylacetoacetate hydrolase family protein [Mycolicibacterium sp. 018/SC-01/001]|uniref:fumarylacetoacetate hydrolase family protein n=1 Tax=Mycolicibacterium sp. 018/SC-01/001 TaxID=2592069 RepID=UPI00117DF0AD|nr:fumarylacetoacetate hydrolase family protein [Mycolicibacterium sp. 018/SC-01/001]TRW89126.1 fumarylacetoacetate hydrolase family protein [Mycolicibacterium sp. 018/SC-01/001]